MLCPGTFIMSLILKKWDYYDGMKFALIFSFSHIIIIFRLDLKQELQKTSSRETTTFSKASKCCTKLSFDPCGEGGRGMRGQQQRAKVLAISDCP